VVDTILALWVITIQEGEPSLDLVVIGVDSLDESMLTGLMLDISGCSPLKFLLASSQILFRILARMHFDDFISLFQCLLRLAYAFYNHTSCIMSHLAGYGRCSFVERCGLSDTKRKILLWLQ